MAKTENEVLVAIKQAIKDKPGYIIYLLRELMPELKASIKSLPSKDLESMKLEIYGFEDRLVSVDNRITMVQRLLADMRWRGFYGFKKRLRWLFTGSPNPR